MFSIMNKTLKLTTFIGIREFNTTVILERARRGTRMRKEKIKAARNRKIAVAASNLVQKRVGKSTKPLANKSDFSKCSPISPLDDVFLEKKYFPKMNTISEAIDMHRELQMPSLYDNPTNKLMLRLELDMTTKKQTKFVSTFKGIIEYPHHFETDDKKTICVLVSGDEMMAEAYQLGATVVHGPEAFKEIRLKRLDISEYDYILAHSSVISSITNLKGILKEKFPQRETVGRDLEKLMRPILKGVVYGVVKCPVIKKDAILTVLIGDLGMTNEQLEENIIALIRKVEKHKPGLKKDILLQTLRLVGNPPPDESFYIDLKLYSAETVAEPIEK